MEIKKIFNEIEYSTDYFEFEPDYNLKWIVLENKIYERMCSKNKKFEDPKYFKKLSSFIHKNFYKDKFKYSLKKYKKEFKLLFSVDYKDYIECFILDKTYFFPNQKSIDKIVSTVFCLKEDIESYEYKNLYRSIVQYSFNLRKGTEYPTKKDFRMSAYLQINKYFRLKNFSKGQIL